MSTLHTSDVGLVRRLRFVSTSYIISFMINPELLTEQQKLQDFLDNNRDFVLALRVRAQTNGYVLPRESRRLLIEATDPHPAMASVISYGLIQISKNRIEFMHNPDEFHTDQTVRGIYLTLNMGEARPTADFSEPTFETSSLVICNILDERKSRILYDQMTFSQRTEFMRRFGIMSLYIEYYRNGMLRNYRPIHEFPHIAFATRTSRNAHLVESMILGSN